MQINNNIQSTTFGCIRVKDGGEEFIRKEGVTDVKGKISSLKDEFKDYKWDLEITKDGYALVSPTTNKTYKGPFSIKRQYSEASAHNKKNSMIIRMDNDNRVKYKVNFNIKEEIKNFYSMFRKSSPIDKIIILLRMLERNIPKVG